MYVFVCVCLARGVQFSEACLFSPSIRVEGSSRVLG